MTTTPQVARDVPFDRQVIETFRREADQHTDDPYGIVPYRINWLWYSRMVSTMELVNIMAQELIKTQREFAEFRLQVRDGEA